MSSIPTPRRPPPVPEHRIRRRSVAFLEREGQLWSCYLVSWPDGTGTWRGHFAFRPSGGHHDGGEVRTADIFLEDSEGAIHARARQLGRPLLGSLLDSAVHVEVRSGDASPFLRRWFRELLAEHSLMLSDTGEPDATPDLDELRSRYASYRLDQVAHFIALVDPADFDEAVDRVLEGRDIDFAARDRLQLAMLVVTFIEERLPLPPFEVWARDYLVHADAYRIYAHTLHREGRLP